MKKIRRIILLIIMFICALSAYSVVNAASATISSNKTSMTVGSTATITVKIKAGAWNLKVSGATSKTIVGYSDDGENTTRTETISFKPSSTGTYTIKLSGDVTDGSTVKTTNISTSITIKVKEKTKSSDATLSNLGITPNDFSNFTSGTLSYNVTVPYETSSIKIYAYANDSNATVSGTGTKSLSTGTNTFNVKVTAEDGTTTKTYTLNITRKATSSVATLSNLGITPHDFSTFTSGTTTYNISVPYDTETIEIYATATSSSASVTGTGTKTLEVGTNTFDVKVTAGDGTTTKTYTLNITRKAESEEDEETDIEETIETGTSEGLTKLEVAGYTFTPDFSTDIYKYQLEITDAITDLDIATETSDSYYEVEIAGNENLQQGENVITILVYDTETDETMTYQIIVNLNEEADLTELNDAMTSAQSNLTKQLWIIKGTIIIIVALIIIFLIERYRLSKKQDDEDEENIANLEDADEEAFEFNYNNFDESAETSNVSEVENDEEEISIHKRTHKKGKRFK